jgi:heat shock protein HtpX
LSTLPTLYYYPARIMNAFAVGTSEKAAIAVSDALLRGLNWREVVAVLAHELSHIGFNDTRIMGFAQISNRITNILSLFGQLVLILSLPAVLMGGPSVNLVAVLLLIGAPMISLFMQMALSRTREYHADLGAARLTGDPEALASALLKMEQHNRHFVGRLPWPGYQRMPDADMLRSHPPTRERIRRLREINAYPWRSVQRDPFDLPVSAHPRRIRGISSDRSWPLCWKGSCF